MCDCILCHLCFIINIPLVNIFFVRVKKKHQRSYTRRAYVIRDSAYINAYFTAGCYAFD